MGGLRGAGDKLMTIIFTQLPWTIESLYQRRASIVLAPSYQRGLVWTTKHKQLFIDSIARGYPIPDMFYFSRENGTTTYEIIDGQQRTNAIWQYLSNEFRLPPDAEPVDGYDISRRLFKELHPSMQERIRNYIVPIKCLQVGEYEQADIFTRLGNSVPLSPAEKRHAITGKFQDLVNDLVNSHPVFSVITLKNHRFSFETLAAQFLAFEIQTPLDTESVSAKNLMQLYVDYRTEEKINAAKPRQAVKRTRYILDYIADMFDHAPTPFLKSVMHIHALYAFLSLAVSAYETIPNATETGQWFVELFQDAIEHMKLPPEQVDFNIANFVLAAAGAKSGITRVTYETAHELRVQYLIAQFKAAFPYLPEKKPEDPRLFSHAQRIEIYHKSGKRCQICAVQISWRNWHADHITPYSKGGKTETSNGQALCPDCNRKKSNRML
jgi:hypothetical protein